MLVAFFFLSSEVIKMINKTSKHAVVHVFPIIITGSQQGHYQEQFSKVTKKTF